MPNYLTVKDVSKRLGVSEDTVRSYITKGVKGIRLVAIDLPRGYRIEETDLQDFLNKLKTQGEPIKDEE
ncbi:MAG TPA: helix-turn-helix domain-containing protein [Ktedonobacteraceae bacterium]